MNRASLQAVSSTDGSKYLAIPRHLYMYTTHPHHAAHKQQPPVMANDEMDTEMSKISEVGGGL